MTNTIEVPPSPAPQIQANPINRIRHLSDTAVLHQAAQDQRYFAELVQRYQKRLSTYLRGYLRQPDTIEDLVQETFIRCWLNRHKFGQIEKVSGWLYTIAGNLAKTELRRQRRWHLKSLDQAEDPLDAALPLADKTPLPDQRLENRMQVEKVLAAIDALPHQFRQAVFLRDVSGLSYQDIAETTGNPLGTVKSRVKRGRAQLHKSLSAPFQELVTN